VRHVVSTAKHHGRAKENNGLTITVVYEGEDGRGGIEGRQMRCVWGWIDRGVSNRATGYE
jgi:hypothetical protein